MTREPGDGRGDWSIGQRLSLGFGLTLLLLLVLMSAVYRWSAESAAAHLELESRISPLGVVAQTLEVRVLSVALGARNWALEPSPAAAATHLQRVSEARAAMEELEKLPKDPDAEVVLRDLRPRLNAFLSDMEAFVREPADRPPLNAELHALRARRELVADGLTRLELLQQAKQRTALDRINAARVSASEGTAIAVGLALVLFAAVAFFTWRSIREPAKHLLEVAAALEEGNWQPALTLPSPGTGRAKHDEMTVLGEAFRAAALALEKREQRLRAEQRIAAAAGASLSKQDIASAALGAVCEHAKADAAALFWVEKNGLEVVASRGNSPAAALAAQVVQAKKPLVQEASAAVPLEVHGQLVGVLVVSALRERDAELVGFLEAAARQLGIGLQNAKAYEQIRALLIELGQKTEQIQAQNEELQTQNEELQVQGEEIQEQNEQLTISEERLRSHARELAAVDQRRSEFLAFLAHELRNPLAAISNSLYVLVNSRADGVVRDRAEQVISRQTRQLARLVDDLLDITRISSGKMRLRMEPLDLAAVVRECVEDSRGRADQAGLSLTLELPPGAVMVKGDRTRLMQVLGNLLDNAIKFGGSGQPVVVRLSAKTEGPVELTVIDQGLGIDAALLPRLFMPFSQADSSLTHRKGGLGLGLALVKAVVELHGGSVIAQSDGLGRGSRFTLLLPVTAAAPQPSAPLPTNRASSRRRVLIIEDSADTAMAMKDSMELCGHEASAASSGASGLEEARRFQPDIVLCDLGLPDMDGYEVARRIRSDEALKHLFLVALSGYATEEDRQRSARAGFDRHLAKPPDIEALERLIEEVPLRRRDAPRDERAYS